MDKRWELGREDDGSNGMNTQYKGSMRFIAQSKVTELSGA